MAETKMPETVRVLNKSDGIRFLNYVEKIKDREEMKYVLCLPRDGQDPHKQEVGKDGKLIKSDGITAIPGAMFEKIMALEANKNFFEPHPHTNKTDLELVKR